MILSCVSRFNSLVSPTIRLLFGLILGEKWRNSAPSSSVRTSAWSTIHYPQPTATPLQRLVRAMSRPVSFQYKNLHFLLKNHRFLLKSLHFYTVGEGKLALDADMAKAMMED